MAAGTDRFIRNQAGKTAEERYSRCGVRGVKQLLQEAAEKARLVTLLVGKRVGTPGGKSNSPDRLGQHALFDANVLGVVADVLTGCGSMRAARAATSSSSLSSRCSVVLVVIVFFILVSPDQACSYGIVAES